VRLGGELKVRTFDNGVHRASLANIWRIKNGIQKRK
jgi:hypothetical protein